VAKLTHAKPAFAAPFAQHALSPANALDAVRIAAPTKAIVAILIMVNDQIAALARACKTFSCQQGRITIAGGRCACQAQLADRCGGRTTRDVERLRLAQPPLQ
jgi:hypothetical protein